MMGESREITFTFDLSRVDVDAVLDILELVGKDSSEYTTKDLAKIVKTMRECLVRSDAKLTGDMVPLLLEQFAAAAVGGGQSEKN